jgi:hypothetical protein
MTRIENKKDLRPIQNNALIHSGRILCLVLFLTFTATIFGQVNQLETDKGIAASIAPYNADVRQAILIASQNPKTLIQLQKDQGQTVESFHKLISGFDQKKQVWFYTLTRYPDLMHTLATIPKDKSKEDIYKLLPTQDAGLQEAAWKLYNNEHKDLIKLDNINISAQEDFNKNIQNLDAPAKAAFQKLSAMPDILTLLTNNIDLTTRLGEHYKSNPVEVNNRLAALHDSLNVQNQYEIAAYKQQMAEDPKATEELGQAAKDYAKENDIDVPVQQNNDMDNADYYANPYSYWFGYPEWYTYPLWYPGSFWFETGLYVGIGGFGIWGLPGYGFSNWYFNGGHYNHYPNLYRQYGNYYRGNIHENRIMGSVNYGFMGNAHNHFNPKGGTQLNRLTTPASYHRAVGQSYQRNTENKTHPNANSYHSQSWGSYGGRDNSVHSSSHNVSSPHVGGGASHDGGGRR